MRKALEQRRKQVSNHRSLLSKLGLCFTSQLCFYPRLSWEKKEATIDNNLELVKKGWTRKAAESDLYENQKNIMEKLRSYQKKVGFT